MEYRVLGNTGVEVSTLCLGTMTFGGPADEKEAILHPINFYQISLIIKLWI